MCQLIIQQTKRLIKQRTGFYAIKSDGVTRIKTVSECHRQHSFIILIIMQSPVPHTQWRNSHITRVDKVQGPRGLKGPQAFKTEKFHAPFVRFSVTVFIRKIVTLCQYAFQLGVHDVKK